MKILAFFSVFFSINCFSYSSSIVNLDSPHFRPLNVSTIFVYNKSTKKSFLEIIEQHGSRELSHLLDYTSVFRKVYADKGILAKASDLIIRIDLSYKKNKYKAVLNTTDLNQKKMF